SGRFVLAADGRARENGQVKSNKMQKVFQAGHLPVAYALCGRATFDSNNGKTVVDLFKETPYAVAAIPSCDNVDSYSMAVGRYLATALSKAQDEGDFAALPTKEADRTGNNYYFAHLFLAGYFSGQPA